MVHVPPLKVFILLDKVLLHRLRVFILLVRFPSHIYIQAHAHAHSIQSGKFQNLKLTLLEPYVLIGAIFGAD